MLRRLCLLALCAGLFACRPLRSGGGSAARGTLGTSTHLAVEPEGEAALQVELPAPGALVVVVAKPAPDLELSVRDAAGRLAAQGEATGSLRAGELAAGSATLEVRSRSSEPAGLDVTLLFDPAEPDRAPHPGATPATARKLPLGRSGAEGEVDYSAMKRTNYWKVSLPAAGALTVRFEPRGDGIVAEIVDGAGRPLRIPADGTATREGLPAGDVLVRVAAGGPGDGGAYRLSASLRTLDPCSRGGPACSLEGAEELKLPADARQGVVDPVGRHFHFYRLAIREKGRVELRFERRSRGRASLFAMRSPDDEGERIASTGAVEVEPGELWLRVQASRSGGAARYAVSVRFVPAR